MPFLYYISDLVFLAHFHLFGKDTGPGTGSREQGYEYTISSHLVYGFALGREKFQLIGVTYRKCTLVFLLSESSEAFIFRLNLMYYGSIIFDLSSLERESRVVSIQGWVTNSVAGLKYEPNVRR